MCFLLMLAAYRDQTKTYKGTYSLTGIESAVYVRMALYASEDGGNIYPSLNTLVAELKFCKTAIKEAVKSLLRKNRIILIKRGSSQTHTSNEYRLNLNLLQDNVSIKPPVYDDSVDKSVDNLCIYNTPVSSDALGAGSSPVLGAGSPDAPHNHIIQSLNKSHLMLKDPQQLNIKNELMNMKVNKKSIERWVSGFGSTALTETIVAIKEQENKKGTPIKNKGAYLRKILEQKRYKL